MNVVIKMNIVILGCGSIAHRVAKGIEFSKGTLYGVASRDYKRAKEFANLYDIPHIYDYDSCLKDDSVDLIYIATINPTHYELTRKVLESGKHVICEKPFVSTSKEIEELFEIAKKNNCFLMEAHKTCFTPLNEYLMTRIHELGKIKTIEASYCDAFDENKLKENNLEEKMGGSFYDIGVYPLCYSNLIANSEIQSLEFDVQKYKHYDCDFDCTCKIVYENGIISNIQSSWSTKKENKAIIKGEYGTLEVVNFWKNTEAKLTINGVSEMIYVDQKSDFTGEINHAIECIKKGLIESPVMSKNASIQISYVLEEMKRNRSF